MTKEEVIRLYISDLKNLVKNSDARENRINTLMEELEKDEFGECDATESDIY